MGIPISTLLRGRTRTRVRASIDSLADLNSWRPHERERECARKVPRAEESSGHTRRRVSNLMTTFGDSRLKNYTNSQSNHHELHPELNFTRSPRLRGAVGHVLLVNKNTESEISL